MAVGWESDQADGTVCATNLYIEAEGYGRRCNPTDRCTIQVFAGADTPASEYERIAAE